MVRVLTNSNRKIPYIWQEQRGCNVLYICDYIIYRIQRNVYSNAFLIKKKFEKSQIPLYCTFIIYYAQLGTQLSLVIEITCNLHDCTNNATLNNESLLLFNHFHCAITPLHSNKQAES